MNAVFEKRAIATATLAAITAIGLGAVAQPAQAAKTPGTYVSGDFHNHTTCSDGSISMQKLLRKATDSAAKPFNGTAPETPWGLDWFVFAGHGGNGNRNCTLVEDTSLDTPVYPFIAGTGPGTTWENSIGAANLKGNVSGTSPNRNMWRWQSIQEFQYPLVEYFNVLKNLPVFIGLESVVAGHEHTSMAVIKGQLPASLDSFVLPGAPAASWTTDGRRYLPVGSGDSLAMWTYCFDRATSDTSRGGANNYDCSVPGSANAGNPDWNAGAAKLNGASGVNGHNKTLEALKWMVSFDGAAGNASYYVPAHLERAGPFNTAGNNGFNIEHLRNFNNAAPNVAFGFETQPGHHASDQRGEYTIRRNTISGINVDSVGGTTYGGTGVYGAQVGGVWDALLGEGRNWWFFGSSDWHNRGSFGSDDVRSTQDFYPGEYQRNYTMVRNGSDKLRPQTIVDGLRTGNTWVATGQLVERAAFIACASYRGIGARTNAAVQNLAINAALNNTDIDVVGCATMGEKLKVRAGADIIVSLVVRDPSGTNYAPYSFPNPSLKQVGITQPVNAPVLDHIDFIRGLVTGYKTPGAADYSGEWPRNQAWLALNINAATPSLSTASVTGLGSVPDAAKNPSAARIQTFNGATWTTVPGNAEYKVMTFRIPAVQASQYIRARGTNLPPSVPYETDANGEPLADLYTNNSAVRATTGSTTEFIAGYWLRIPCDTVGTNVPSSAVTYTVAQATTAPIDGCPAHLPSGTLAAGVSPNYPAGYTGKLVAYDVAAWSDLWFYSNPIFIEVTGSTMVAGVK